MPAAASKELVIDASVAQAAGWGEQPDSSGSRHFLMAVLEISHRMVLTQPLTDEWRRHQSKFTREWRKSMHAKRKIRTLDSQENAGLREGKPWPGYCEAALRTDNIVVSLDETARQAPRLVGEPGEGGPPDEAVVSGRGTARGGMETGATLETKH